MTKVPCQPSNEQWPDNICGGNIRYAPASNYNGFYLADVAHGIPTFGSVSPTDPVTVRGQGVHVFNYPGQTEQIAAELVLRWNQHATLKARIEQLTAALQFIADGYDNNDVNHLDYRVKVYQMATDALKGTA